MVISLSFSLCHKQNNSNVHSPVAGHVSFSNLSNNASSSAQLSHPHVSSTVHSPAVGWGQEHTDSGHLPVAAAGLRSHLHHSGLAPSPLAGPLLRPQLSSSLQTSGTDHLSHGQASSHLQSSPGPGQLHEQVPARRDTSHPMVNGHVTFQVSDAQSMARVSASLVSLRPVGSVVSFKPSLKIIFFSKTLDLFLSPVPLP